MKVEYVWVDTATKIVDTALKPVTVPLDLMSRTTKVLAVEVYDIADERLGVTNSLKRGIKKPLHFYRKITKDLYSQFIDTYTGMFFMDFVTFIIITVGYTSFTVDTNTLVQDATNGSASETGISQAFQENHVPTTFLGLIFAQFTIILIDRAIYLRKSKLGKLIFQYILVIVIHWYLFFFLPFLTRGQFYTNRMALWLYGFKCAYFLLSAKQIRGKYPTRILQNWLTTKYGYLNLFTFMSYRAIPFLVEIQNTMDWMFVDTTLGVGKWFTLNTIYSQMYVLKCWRHLEDKYMVPRGEKKPVWLKWLGGGFLMIGIIFILWFPLMFMTIVQRVGTVNPPLEVKFSLSISGYQGNLYTGVASQATGTIINWHTPGKLLQFRNIEKLKRLYTYDSSKISQMAPQNMLSDTDDTKYQNDQIRKEALIDTRKNLANLFLNRFEEQDFVSVCIPEPSNTVWPLSWPAKQELDGTLNNSTKKVQLKVSWEVRRYKGSHLVVRSNNDPKNVEDLDTVQSNDLSSILNAQLEDTDRKNLTLINIFPKFLYAKDAIEVCDEATDLTIDQRSDLVVERRVNIEARNQGYMANYWVIKGSDDRLKEKVGTDRVLWIGDEDVRLPELCPSDTTEVIIVSDKTAPDVLVKISSYGIVGLYISMVFVIGRIMRSLLTWDAATIMFTDLPSVEVIWQLFSDLHMVRELQHWRLEEDITAQLVFLFRCPDALIKYTRFPREQNKIKTE